MKQNRSQAWLMIYWIALSVVGYPSAAEEQVINPPQTNQDQDILIRTTISDIINSSSENNEEEKFTLPFTEVLDLPSRDKRGIRGSMPFGHLQKHNRAFFQMIERMIARRQRERELKRASGVYFSPWKGKRSQIPGNDADSNLQTQEMLLQQTLGYNPSDDDKLYDKMDQIRQNEKSNYVHQNLFNPYLVTNNNQELLDILNPQSDLDSTGQFQWEMPIKFLAPEKIEKYFEEEFPSINDANKFNYNNNIQDDRKSSLQFNPANSYPTYKNEPDSNSLVEVNDEKQPIEPEEDSDLDLTSLSIKRSSNNDFEYHDQLNNIVDYPLRLQQGKRKTSVKQPFGAWLGKRYATSEQTFSPWRGKKDIVSGQAFRSWIGKRDIKSKQTFSPWRGKKYVVSGQTFSPWRGKRDAKSGVTFAPWKGKRIYKCKSFQPWCGKRNVNSDKKFRSWIGKR